DGAVCAPEFIAGGTAVDRDDERVGGGVDVDFPVACGVAVDPGGAGGVRGGGVLRVCAVSLLDAGGSAGGGRFVDDAFHDAGVSGDFRAEGAAAGKISVFVGGVAGRGE